MVAVSIYPETFWPKRAILFDVKTEHDTRYLDVQFAVDTGRIGCPLFARTKKEAVKEKILNHLTHCKQSTGDPFYLSDFL